MRQTKHGFSLIELMIAVAIIGILAAVALPSYRTYIVKGSRSACQIEIVQLAALQEKVLWGDLADVFHMIVAFSARRNASLPSEVARVRDTLVDHGFGTITLHRYAGGGFPFLSSTFQDLMLEIWRVKYLQMPRFGDVIRRTAARRLDHFLDDGDSPDIPIPVYVNQLNRIRDLALAQRKK